MTPASEPAALVLFSGGQDSTVCLAWALTRYAKVETIGFDYGQRHRVELTARERVRDRLGGAFPAWRARLGADHVLALPALGQISETSLTRDTAIAFTDGGLPSTFVPGRNLLFFTYAAALGYRRGLDTLVGGMCETDYSGYPDCRDATLKSLATSLSLGMDRSVHIETPLMFVDKAGTWAMAAALGGDPLVQIILEDTHSCYLGDRSHRHDWGYGCGTCPACELRARGWQAWRSAREGGGPVGGT
ncbi:MAG: 7-cyano-7-deazaguanine synthase QueC [Hyphomicrobiaceae bacterium]|nr:7-cyano-7-deazaguanine synthase QueC [Hyphomicrobiaceae bacterium]